MGWASIWYRLDIDDSQHGLLMSQNGHLRLYIYKIIEAEQKQHVKADIQSVGMHAYGMSSLTSLGYGWPTENGCHLHRGIITRFLLIIH